MVTALDNGVIAGYICDFPTPELLQGNVIAMPHIGASTAEAEENCAVMANQLMDFIENGTSTIRLISRPLKWHAMVVAD